VNPSILGKEKSHRCTTSEGFVPTPFESDRWAATAGGLAQRAPHHDERSSRPEQAAVELQAVKNAFIIVGQLTTVGLKRKHTVILLVEDDTQTREFYRSVIKAAGYEVAAVEDGLAALRRIDIEPPDVIVLDLMLPKLAGVDVFQELQSKTGTRNIPVIAVTGADLLRNMDTTAFHYFLRKPVTADVLVATIDQALKRQQPTG